MIINSAFIQRLIMIILPQVREIIASFFKTSTPTKASSLAFINVSGGCINQCYRVTDSNKRSVFVKLNSISQFPGLLLKEKNGLKYLQNQQIIKTPAVKGYEEEGEFQLLVMEWIDQAGPTQHSWNKLGEQLAHLHRVTSQQYGFDQDNYIGSLPQENTWQQSWVKFFVEHRLKPQINLAKSKGLLTNQHQSLFEKLFVKLPEIFDDEKPALLHGDLWRGNLVFDTSTDPVLIDPSVYFGSRHMDLAMTTLFGGFDKAFYDSYHHHYPLPQNHKQQWDICNLYPLLVHVNLFGGSYVSSVQSILKKYS